MKYVHRLRFTGCYEVVTLHSCKHQSCRVVERTTVCNLGTAAPLRVPCSDSLNCHTTPCSSLFKSLPKCLHPVLRGRTLPTRREDLPNMLLRPLHSVATKLNTQVLHNTMQVSPGSNPFVFPMLSHGCKSAYHKGQSVHVSLVIVQALNSNSLPNCLVPRHSFIHSKLWKVLTFLLATFVYKQWVQ